VTIEVVRVFRAYSTGEPQHMLALRGDPAHSQEATVRAGAWASSVLLCSEMVSTRWVTLTLSQWGLPYLQQGYSRGSRGQSSAASEGFSREASTKCKARTIKGCKQQGSTSKPRWTQPLLDLYSGG